MKPKSIVFLCLLFFFNENYSQTKTDYKLLVWLSHPLKTESNNDIETLLQFNPDLLQQLEGYHLKLEKAITIPEEKLDFLEREAIRISKNAESVRKLRNIRTVTIDNPSLERLLKIKEILDPLPMVNDTRLISLQPIPPPTDIPPVTTNFEPDQAYLYENPGVDMDYAWSLGLNGTNIKIRDIEYGFNKSHEELLAVNAQIATGMTISNDASESYTEHGTGVFGILFAHKGSYGVTGMCHGATEIILYPEWQTTGYSRINAITKAINDSQAGDVIIYEMQTFGENNNYVPAEFESLVWDLTKAATDAGIIIVAAAGNGNQNLDSSYYTSYINRGDSGAILVGAGTADVFHNKRELSTYGTRVDLQAWGTNVLTSGYGTFITFGNDFNQRYVQFSGTSSATAIVAACAVVLQSYYYEKTGSYLTSIAMRNILKETGISQGSGGNIGPIPNMKAAILKINSDIALGITASDNLTSFSLYPNPANDMIYLHFNQNINQATVACYNVIGQELFTIKVDEKNNKIPITNLKKGMYLIKVQLENKTLTQKFIKK